MKKETYDYLWKYVIVEHAKQIFKEENIPFDQKKFDQKYNDIKNCYDNLRGYSKFAYLKNPDGLSNRFLVATYLILAIAKTKPINAGENEGTFKNEQLAIRVGIWTLTVFNAPINQNNDENQKRLWNKDNISLLLEQLGDFKEFLYSHLYYDINDRIYSILEMSNMIWMIESYIKKISMLVDDKREKILNELNALNNNRILSNQCIRNLKFRWDDIWIDVISDVAIQMVDKNKGRAEFDRTSKYIVLDEFMALLNEARDNYVTLHEVSADKYIITACFILAIAKSQPLRYKYDIHAKKGIYNENLALEAGLRLLYQFKIFELRQNAAFTEPYKKAQRFLFPDPFHNKTYKELLCLMLHYDIRENKYGVLAIANILFMIDAYTQLLID